jgi:hypothetical protein
VKFSQQDSMSRLLHGRDEEERHHLASLKLFGKHALDTKKPSSETDLSLNAELNLPPPPGVIYSSYSEKPCKSYQQQQTFVTANELKASPEMITSAFVEMKLHHPQQAITRTFAGSSCISPNTQTIDPILGPLLPSQQSSACWRAPQLPVDKEEEGRARREMVIFLYVVLDSMIISH